MEEEPHKELCEFVVSQRRKKKLILLPRGAFKSSVVTVGYVLWRLVEDPDIRILISSETYSQSKTFLTAIKDHIERNEVFRGIFGNLKGEEGVWRQEEITIEGRKRVAREPSISVSGVGMTRVGLHYDLIILDDVVSNNNINTSEQIQKIINHYRLLLSILDPGKELIIVGTRYSFADLYGHILEEEKGVFATLIRGAYNKDGSLYFPTRLTKDFLDGQRKSQGNQHFANQYLNQPLDQDSAMFKVEWIRYFNTPPENTIKYMLIDPATAETKTADFTGIIICAVDHNSNIFVLEAINNKSSIGEMIDFVFLKVQQYQIHTSGCVGLETNAVQQTYGYIFSEEMTKRKFFFPLTELKNVNHRTKIQRVQALQPWFEGGKIYMRKEQSELFQQITMFPRCKHDDLIDSFSMILKVMSPPTAPAPADKWEESPLTYNEKRIWQEKEEMGKRMVRRTKIRL
jgi:predicted phage terminase large subunit-like protein